MPGAAAAALVAVTMLATLPLVGEGLRIIADSRAVDRLGAELAARAQPADLVVHEGPIEASGALELYSGRRPALLDGTRSVLGFGATFADARDTFWTRGAVQGGLAVGSHRCFSSRRARPSGA